LIERVRVRQDDDPRHGRSSTVRDPGTILHEQGELNTALAADHH
jgi:hypothetical protein